MTKLVVQLMLSVIVGIGAAMGFSPKVQADVHDTLSHANASLHGTVSAAVKNTNKVKANVSTAISVRTNAGSSSNAKVKADLSLKTDLKTKMNAGDASPASFLPDLSVKDSLTNGTQTNLEVYGSGLNIGVKDNTKSTLNLNLGSDK